MCLLPHFKWSLKFSLNGVNGGRAGYLPARRARDYASNRWHGWSDACASDWFWAHVGGTTDTVAVSFSLPTHLFPNSWLLSFILISVYSHHVGFHSVWFNKRDQTWQVWGPGMPDMHKSNNGGGAFHEVTQPLPKNGGGKLMSRSFNGISYASLMIN